MDTTTTGDRGMTDQFLIAYLETSQRETYDEYLEGILTEKSKAIALLEKVAEEAELYFNSIDCGRAEKPCIEALAAAGYLQETGE